MTASEPIAAETLAEAFKHCAALARAHARDQWLGALYAPVASRDALNALACFDYEIRQARWRARDPNLAALRLAWWREAALGAGGAEASGSPAALALRAAISGFALPGEAIEAMLDARLTEIAPPDDFTLAAFERYAAESALEWALHLYRDSTADFADCLHAGLSGAAGKGPLLSFDAKAARLPGVELLQA